MKTLQLSSTTHQQREIEIRLLQKTKFIFALLLSVFIFTSCSDDDDGDDCIDEIHTENVISVDAPETVRVDEQINVKVQFRVSNACGEFNRFIETGTGISTEIAVEAVYEGCACAEVIETRTVDYPFEADEPGEYELNFRSGETEFITVTITVMETE